MLLVIFGAGASYDSAPSYPPSPGDGLVDRPPLANELFDNRLRFADALTTFWECQPLVPRLRDLNHFSPAVTLESQLEGFRAEAETYPKRHKQLAAVRYYLHYVLWQIGNEWQRTHRGITNYATFLDDVERWRVHFDERVCIVTFNYDRMLEQSLIHVGVNIQTIDDYVGTEFYKVIKIHGSVNWARVVQAPTVSSLHTGNEHQVAHELIDGAAEISFTDQYSVADVYPISFVRRNETQRVAALPAVAIPMFRKTTFECPASHLDALKKCIPRVTKIITVGWRGVERHFLDLLSGLARQAELFTVGADSADAETIAEGLMQSDVAHNFFAAKGGFTDAIRNREFDSFLWRG